MRVRNSFKARSGQAIVMFTLMVSSVLIPMVGLAIDGGRAYLVRLKLSSAVDGSALAAARLLGTGANASQQLAYAQATAVQFVNANFPAKFFGADLAAPPNVCVDPGVDSSDPCHVGNGSSISTYKMRTVLVSASAQMPTFFMRILGLPTVTVGASGLASRRDVRVVLVIDRSSSMAGYFGSSANSVVPMAQKFVKSFSGQGDFGGRDEMGLVVFGGSAIVAYPPRDISNDYTDYTKFSPPDNQFKLAGNMLKDIGDLTDGSNTGTAEALYLAHMILRADGQTNPDVATKLNVIVLFTDGLPNGITAFANDPNATTQMLKAGCTYQANGNAGLTPLASSSAFNKNMIGWFAQWGGFANPGSNTPRGLYKPMMAYAHSGYTGHGDDIDKYMSDAGADSSQIGQMTGCTTDPMTVMKQFPDHDLFGNYTNLSTAPAVNGMKPPLGPGGVDLYRVGSLYNTASQCNHALYQPTQTTNSCQVGLASWQATAHQAWKIWNQVIWDKATQQNIADPATYQAQPVVFTIGFDHSPTDPPDMTLLKLIANDPGSPAPFSTRMKGQAFRASDPSAVDSAFQQIASQILRLSQ